MAEPRHTPHPIPPDPELGARLPALTQAGRELMEVLWRASRPLTTRQLQDAIARCFPHRARRKINTTSSLLAALHESGWVVGRKRGGTRWVYEPAVSRDEEMRQLAPGGGGGVQRAAGERVVLGVGGAGRP